MKVTQAIASDMPAVRGLYAEAGYGAAINPSDIVIVAKFDDQLTWPHTPRKEKTFSRCADFREVSLRNPRNIRFARWRSDCDRALFSLM